MEWRDFDAVEDSGLVRIWVVGVIRLKLLAMAVAWGALSSAPQPGCLGHGQHYTSSWATMQGLHLQQMMFASKGEAVLAGAAASQQSNARIAKSNRRSRYGEALPTFGFDDEIEGGSPLLSQLLSDVSF